MIFFYNSLERIYMKIFKLIKLEEFIIRINKIYNIFLISVKEFFREPEILFWAFLFPVLLALVLGLAFDLKKDIQYPIGIVDQNHDSPHLMILEQNKNLKLYILNEDEIHTYLKRGRINLYIEIKNDKIHIYYDNQNDNAKLAYLEVLKTLTKNNDYILDDELHLPGSRYLDYLIPGLIAMNIMNSAIWGIGWTFISMRIKKLLKLFSVSPIDKNYFFIGYTLARLLLSLAETFFLVFTISLFFPITFLGRMGDFLIVYIIGYLSFTGIAIFAGSRARNSVVGNSIINFITLPMMLLSGIFFSYETFPSYIVNVITYLPLTLLADMFRRIFLEGSSLLELKDSLLILMLEGYLFYFVGKKYFLWK